MIRLVNLLKENNILYTIYCDLDGVLTNFDKAYFELTGMRANVAKDKLSPQEFWFPISNAGRDWWANLEWMPDGKQLWSYIKGYKPFLLSAPSKERSSKVGKRQWVNNNISDPNLIITASWNKQKYSGPTNILIDDTKKNIDDWISKGGIGILHISASKTIKRLKDLEI